jgi:membrane protein insertase Oxa1/YidC/SpoIIIJ
MRRLVSSYGASPSRVLLVYAPRGPHALALAVSVRPLSLNPVSWFRKKEEEQFEGGISSKLSRTTNPALEDELPEVFANQPTEVDDYIRPEKSLFEKLEDGWDFVASFLQPIDKQISIMRSWHSNGPFGSGLDLGGWGPTFMAYGFVMRCITLIPALYGHRNSLRLGRINPQLSQFNEVLKKTKQDRTLSTAEKRVIQDGYKRMKKQLCAQHHCAQWKSSIGMISTPLTLTAFLAIRKMVVYEADLETTPFMWLKDLTAPDPTWTLPVLCAGLFYMNFELNQGMMKGSRSSNTIYIKWGIRIGLVAFVYFAADSQPAAMFAYWLGMSAAGLLQPLLLRMQWFRDMFGFPEPPDAAKSNIIGSTIKGPSMYERVFASREEKAKLAEERRQQVEDERARKAFQRIDDFDVILEADMSPGGSSARSSGRPKS